MGTGQTFLFQMEKQIKRKRQWVPNSYKTQQGRFHQILKLKNSPLYGVFNSWSREAKYLHAKDLIRISLNVHVSSIYIKNLLVSTHYPVAKLLIYLDMHYSSTPFLSNKICISHSGCYSKILQMVYEASDLLLIVLEAGNPKIKLLADLAPDLQTADLPLCPNMPSPQCINTKISPPTNPTVKAPPLPNLTLITSQRPHVQIPSLWDLGL